MQKLINENKWFFWGFNENKTNHKNPYMAMIAYSDNIIVSGESISMISEVCSLDSSIGVYIFFPKSFCSKRYINFHKNLYKNNYAHPP